MAHPAPEPKHRVAAEHWYGLVAITATFVYVTLLIAGINVHDGIASLVRLLAAISWAGCIIHFSIDPIRRRLDQLESKDEFRAGYSEGYVDGLARRAPSLEDTQALRSV